MNWNIKAFFTLVSFVLLSLALTVPVVYADHNGNAPNASFTVSPPVPVTGERVTFTSSSSDSDGRIVFQAWDLDNDGSYDDATGATASRTFPTAGSKTVRLRVIDDDWRARTSFRRFTVRVNAPPTVGFSANPSPAFTGQNITLTSSSTDPDRRPLLQEWDLDGNGTFGDETGGQVTTSFASNGVHRVGLRVTDSGGARNETFRDITVHNRPPLSTFEASATDVDTGESIEFKSTSKDPDGEIRSHRWDFDGDGVTDASGATTNHSFADNGTYSVTLTVVDDDGGATPSAPLRITVRNRLPSASFDYAPLEPLAGDEVVFTSTARDLDGDVTQHRWDLDGDGVFDDGTGAQARTSFAKAGSYTVALVVRDNDGALSAPTFTSIEVAARPAPPATGPPTGQTDSGQKGFGSVGKALIAPRLLRPFPSVRIRGVTTLHGARLDLLSVRTPGGTRILVRCKGRLCPWPRKLMNVRFSQSVARPVRVPGFNRRRLRAGTVVEVFVTRSGMIGKYTRFRIRRLAPPRRVDRCTLPGVARAWRCPAG